MKGLACVIVLAGFLTACQKPKLPGESVGRFSIVSSLEDNACHSQLLPTLGQFRFAAELGEDRDAAWWKRERAQMVWGRKENSGAYLFQMQLQRTPPTQQPADCALSQQERLRVQVSPEEPMANRDGGAEAVLELTGTHEIEVRALGACMLADFQPIPCTASYSLQGVQAE